MDNRHLYNVLPAVLLGLALCSCNSKPASDEAAKQKLASQLIPFDAATFVQSAANGDTKTMKEELAAGMAPDVSVSGTAMMAAAKNGRLAAVKLLVENKADVNTGSDMLTPLMAAAQRGHLQVVEFLLANKAKVNRHTMIGSALFLAAKNGHAEVVDLLLKNGADVDYTLDPKERTALMEAAFNGHAAVIDSLLNYEADLNAKDIDGRTALDLATLNSQADCIKLLLAKGTDVVHNPPWWNPFSGSRDDADKALIDAITHDDAKAARGIIAKGANVNAKAYAQMPLLLWAVKTGHFEGAKLLIEKGADKSVTDADGKTLLDYSLAQENYDFACYLNPALTPVIQARRKDKTLKAAAPLPAYDTIKPMSDASVKDVNVNEISADQVAAQASDAEAQTSGQAAAAHAANQLPATQAANQAVQAVGKAAAAADGAPAQPLKLDNHIPATAPATNAAPAKQDDKDLGNGGETDEALLKKIMATEAASTAADKAALKDDAAGKAKSDADKQLLESLLKVNDNAGADSTMNAEDQRLVDKLLKDPAK